MAQRVGSGVSPSLDGSGDEGWRVVETPRPLPGRGCIGIRVTTYLMDWN